MTREEAIKHLSEWMDEKMWRCFGTIDREAIGMAIEALNEVQKHEETFEWCHDCKEYDTENYCCHRWSKVIRNTVEELKANDEDEPQFYTEDDYWNGMFTESAEAYKTWTGEEMGKTSDLISRADAMSKCKNAEKELTDEAERKGLRVGRFIIGELPSADAVSREDTNMLVGLRNFKEYIRGYNSATADVEQGWSNHEVACMLAELFGDDCACNYNGIDEWLPMVCDFKDNCKTVGAACWEQFLKHYGEAWGNNFNEQLSKSIKYEQTTPYKGGDAE